MVRDQMAMFMERVAPAFEGSHRALQSGPRALAGR
jgi:hypothetical protein